MLYQFQKMAHFEKLLFIGAISFGGCVIWCIVGLLVSRFALHFWVVVVE